MSILKPEFHTVRQLEKRTIHVFKYAGLSFIAGVVLTVSGYLAFVGIPLIVVGVIVALIGMIWTSVLGREGSRPVFCPYCSSKNDVYRSVNRLNCDICGRTMTISPNGEGIPLEPIGPDSV